jgi:hypothetical protein
VLADIYRTAERTADEARLDLARALADGRMTVRVDSSERRAAALAIVRGLHVGALGIGYSQANVVVAEQRDPRLPAHDGMEKWPERPLRKLTISWLPDRVKLDGSALVAALNEAEVSYRAKHGIAIGPGSTDLSTVEGRRPGAEAAVGAGWGGNLTSGIVGSPTGDGSVLPLADVVRLVREACS